MTLANSKWPKLIIAVILLTILIFLFFSFITFVTKIDSPNTSGGWGGCNAIGNRKISIFLFPLEDPMQCIWRNEDAFANLPYHFLLSLIAVLIYNKLKSKKDINSANFSGKNSAIGDTL